MGRREGGGGLASLTAAACSLTGVHAAKILRRQLEGEAGGERRSLTATRLVTRRVVKMSDGPIATSKGLNSLAFPNAIT